MRTLDSRQAGSGKGLVFGLLCALVAVAGCIQSDDSRRRDSGGDPMRRVGPPLPAAPQAGAPAPSPQDPNSGTTGTPSVPPANQPVLPLPPGFDAGSDPYRNAVQPGQVCGRLAQIQCAGESFCCPSPGRDRAACEATMLNVCVNELYLDAITANPITAFDPASAQFAFDRIELLASQCNPEIARVGGSQEGLLGMMRGTIEPGGDCFAGVDKAQAAAALASCLDGATTACMPRSAFNWSCDPRGGAGATCFTDLNCQEGVYCPNPALTSGGFGTGRCSARKPVSGSCKTGNECASLFCRGGLCVEPSVEAAFCLARP